MKQYSRIRALIASFASSKLYRDVADHWTGIGFSYLLLLVLLYCIPVACAVVGFAHLGLFAKDPEGETWVTRTGYLIARQIPPMEWKKGVLEVDAEQPYRISLGVDEKDIVIDTTGKLLSPEEAKASVLFTRDEVLAEKENGAIESYRYRKFMENGEWDGNARFNGDMAEEFVHVMTGWMLEHQSSILAFIALVSYAFAVFITFLYRMIAALILGGIGMLFCKALRVTMFYQTSVRLACVAMTPVMLLSLLSIVLGWNVPWVAGVALGLGYMYFAIWSNRGTLNAPSS